jgi:hypothetical protein
VLFGEEIAPVLQVVAASEQQPTLFSFDVKGFVDRSRREIRKFLAFASAAITIRDLLIQIVQHSAKTPAPDARLLDNKPLIIHLDDTACDISRYRDRSFGPQSNWLIFNHKAADMAAGNVFAPKELGSVLLGPQPAI